MLANLDALLDFAAQRYPDTAAGRTDLIAELNRSASHALGLNLAATGAANTLGTIGTGQFGQTAVNSLRAPVNFTITDALNVFAFRPDLGLAAFVKALQNQGLLQIIAEQEADSGSSLLTDEVLDYVLVRHARDLGLL